MVLEVVVGRSAMTHDIAAQLGLNQAVKLLETALGEEKKTDETLTKLAQSKGQPGRAGGVTPMLEEGSKVIPTA